MIVNESNPLAVHDIGCHTEQQIKRAVLYILPLFSCPPSLLPTSLNQPSPAWWAPLSSAPYTNEQCLCQSNGPLYFSLRLLYPFPSPHFCTEPLFGETTEKPLLDCCACGTAKYRVTFYGNWSEKTHPKDYPRKQKTAGPHHQSFIPHIKKTPKRGSNMLLKLYTNSGYMWGVLSKKAYFILEQKPDTARLFLPYKTTRR